MTSFWSEERFKRGQDVNLCKLKDLIGRGTYSNVWTAEYGHRKTCAIKIYRPEEAFSKQGNVEISVLRELQKAGGHPCVIRCGAYSSMDGCYCLTLELLGWNLYQLIEATKFRGVSLDLTLKFAVQLYDALVFLKQNSVIHCDIKPENICLANNMCSNIKLIDFGCAQKDDGFHEPYAQSRYYRAPEVLNMLPYSYPVDMWSLGCVLVELYTADPIFPGKNATDQLSRIVNLKKKPRGVTNFVLAKKKRSESESKREAEFFKLVESTMAFNADDRMDPFVAHQQALALNAATKVRRMPEKIPMETTADANGE